jgi:ferrochelatase
VLFSFHSLPEPAQGYKEQCLQSAQAIATAARLARDQYSVGFQSKSGSGEWTTPETRAILSDLLKGGKKRVLVMCPSFVVDCLETLGEVAGEYRAFFLSQGGETLGLVESLNDFRPWVEQVATTLKTYLGNHER